MDRYITVTQVRLATDIATVIAGCLGYGVNEDGRLLLIRLTFLKTARARNGCSLVRLKAQPGKNHQVEAPGVRGFALVILKVTILNAVRNDSRPLESIPQSTRPRVGLPRSEPWRMA